MHAIERELIKVTGYKAQRKFSDRQDYLKSILNAINKLDNDDFDNLSDEAAIWANNAVEAHNGKQELPDFDETDVDEEEAIEEASAEAAGLTEPVDDDESEDDESEDEIDPETGEVLEDEPEEEVEPEKPAKKKPKQLDLPLVKEKAAKPVKKAPTITPFAHDAVLDKWGAIEGSKNSMALAIFEKGATAKEVKEKLGGTYYNILGRAVKAGHVLEKEGALMKLTHVNDIGKKPPLKKAPVDKSLPIDKSKRRRKKR
jgi:hypothetical protein